MRLRLCWGSTRRGRRHRTRRRMLHGTTASPPSATTFGTLPRPQRVTGCFTTLPPPSPPSSLTRLRTTGSTIWWTTTRRDTRRPSACAPRRTVRRVPFTQTLCSPRTSGRIHTPTTTRPHPLFAFSLTLPTVDCMWQAPHHRVPPASAASSPAAASSMLPLMRYVRPSPKKFPSGRPILILGDRDAGKGWGGMGEAPRRGEGVAGSAAPLCTPRDVPPPPLALPFACPVAGCVLIAPAPPSPVRPHRGASGVRIYFLEAAAGCVGCGHALPTSPHPFCPAVCPQVRKHCRKRHLDWLRQIDRYSAHEVSRRWLWVAAWGRGGGWGGWRGVLGGVEQLGPPRRRPIRPPIPLIPPEPA